MKIGDKLLCIKDYDRLSVCGTVVFHSGCKYEITLIHKPGKIHVLYNDGDVGVNMCYMLFYTNSTDYNEHFISICKERKNKLKKINENR